jgi:hypothetical protein
VANEAPADIKSNMIRAWANFSQERVETCTKPSEFKVRIVILDPIPSVGFDGWDDD